jgi:hypothetical protein
MQQWFFMEIHSIFSFIKAATHASYEWKLRHGFSVALIFYRRLSWEIFRCSSLVPKGRRGFVSEKSLVSRVSERIISALSCRQSISRLYCALFPLQELNVDASALNGAKSRASAKWTGSEEAKKENFLSFQHYFLLRFSELLPHFHVHRKEITNVVLIFAARERTRDLILINSINLRIKSETPKWDGKKLQSDDQMTCAHFVNLVSFKWRAFNGTSKKMEDTVASQQHKTKKGY